MGNDLKNQILVRNGIITKEAAVMQRKPSVLSCPRCSLVNAIENKYCSKCTYPLVPSAFVRNSFAQYLLYLVTRDKNKENRNTYVLKYTLN
jgi:ribosomal protein L40E